MNECMNGFAITSRSICKIKQTTRQNTHAEEPRAYACQYKRSKNFDKRPNRLQKIIRRSQDRGKAVDNGLSVGKVVQFLLYGKNASSVSREYVGHAWMISFGRPAGRPRHGIVWNQDSYVNLIG